MLCCWLTSIILILHFGVSESIRNVELIMPPLVRAGSSATLLCLFDLERAPLYSVKWYRGQFEFYRFMPKENPPSKVFPLPGVYIDIYTSNQHQVTLHNVPTSISGEVSCEVTTDAPGISTATVSAMLNVQQMDIDLSVPQTRHSSGSNLLASCAATTPARIAFYINSYKVPAEFVTQTSFSSATLNITIQDRHFQSKGELRLQCSGAISEQYYISTKVVTIRHFYDPDVSNGSSSRKMSKVWTLCTVMCFLCHTIM